MLLCPTILKMARSSSSDDITSSDSEGDIPPILKKMKSERETKKVKEDRISALPDSLLIHILSLLGCTKEAVRSCLLSKRWEFLWTDFFSEVRLHEFSSDIAKNRVFVDWVGRMISMCKALKRFHVSFQYDKCFASNVKHWVYFAIQKEVKDIALTFTNTNRESFCELPQMLYSYSSLTNLSITSCVMAPLGIIAWGSLKDLTIDGVELLDSVMENILSNCHVLRYLNLYSCWGLNYLIINSPNLTSLVIHSFDSRNKNVLDISAPYLCDLSIICNATGRLFRLTNVSSAVEISFDFYHLSAGEMSTLDNVKLLEILTPVKSLELGKDCVQIVSMLEVKSMELPLYSQLQWLELNVWSREMSIPGILAILRSSPKLETLLIDGWRTYDRKKPELDQYGIHLEDCNMDLVASHLKTVKITGFTEQDLAEYMLTLVKILLKSAKVLKKMVIRVEKPSSSTSTKIAKRLLTFPRASPKGVVVFR